MKDNKYDKKQTLMFKGIGIIFMFMHHLFYSMDHMVAHNVKSLIFSCNQISRFSMHIGKVCVAIFVFCTAYGLSARLNEMTLEGNVGKKELKKISISQFIKLIMMFQFTAIICNMFCYLTNFNSPIEIYKNGGSNLSGLINFILDLSGLSYYLQSPTLSSPWWYMSLAILLTFLVPVIWKAYKQFGFILLPLALLFPKFVGMVEITGVDGSHGEQNNFAWYIFTIVLGVFACENNIFERISHKKFLKNCFMNNSLKFISAIIILYITIVLRIDRGYVFINDAIISLILAYFVFDFIGRIPIIKQILIIVGTYSYDMYLVHALIIGYASTFIYSTRYVASTVFLLVLVSLILSIIISGLRKIVKYDKVSKHVCNTILKWTEGIE